MSRRPDAWAHPRGHRRKMCGGAASGLAHRCPRPRVGVRAEQGDTGSQNATRLGRAGNVTCYGSKLYFETKPNSAEKCTIGSFARAGSEARPGSERLRPAAGRRPMATLNVFHRLHRGFGKCYVKRSGNPSQLSTGQNLKRRSSGSPRPSASVHYRRTDAFESSKSVSTTGPARKFLSPLSRTSSIPYLENRPARP